MRKKILVICAVIMAICALTLYGCKENSVDTPPSTTEISVEFRYENILMVVEDKLTPEISYANGTGAPTFSSSDASIVSVNEKGELKALREGQVTITAQYGDKSDTLVVNSSFDVYVPTLSFEQAVSNSMTLNQNESINLNAYVSFRGKSYSDSTIKFEVDKTTAKIENGIFTATECGDYKVTIQAEWRGFNAVNSLEKEITIKVLPVIEVYVNDNTQNSFDLYTMYEFGGNTFVNSVPFVVSAKYNGTEVEPTITFVSGEEHVNVSEDTLTAVSYGTSVIEISYQDVKKTITVNVNPVYADYKGDRIAYSAMDGDLPLDEIFGEEVTLITAFDDLGNTYEIVDNKICGIEVKGAPLETSLTVCTEVCGYKINIIAYTKIIKTQADLQSIFKITSYETVSGKDVWGSTKNVLKINEFDGYYLLGNDIKAEAGSVHRVLPGDYLIKSPYSDFDGNYGKDSPINTNPSIFADDNATAAEQAKAEIGPKDLIFNKADGTDLDCMLYHQGGLTGTFDGNGHSIEDLYIYGPGIFGIIDGGTVKNVAFKNVKFTGAYGVSKATLAYSMANATLENVYIQTEALTIESWDKTYSVYKTAYTSDAFTSRALVAMSAVGTINMKNCVFICPEIEATDADYEYSYGSLFAQAHAFHTFKTTSSVENVYVVSPYALGAKSNNKKNILYFYDSNVSSEATKYEIATQYGVDFNANAAINTTIHSAPAGVKRYDDLDKMQAAGNDYASFSNSECWKLDTTTGLPVWSE